MRPVVFAIKLGNTGRLNARFAASATLSLFLVGCASLYVPPTGKNVATLTVQNDSIAKVVPGTFADNKTCSGAQNFVEGTADPSMAPRSTIKVVIAAGGDFSLSIFAQQRGFGVSLDTCNMVGTFVPKIGASYFADFRTDSRRCFLTLKEEIRDGKDQIKYVYEPSFRLRETKPAITGGGMCK